MDLEAVLEEFLNEFMFRRDLKDDTVQLRNNVDAGTRVRMDAAQFRQVLINLIENGLRYSEGNPAMVITIAMDEASGRPYLDVRDFGPGIRDADVQHLFEPFFTTAAAGTGLGLYIARELCEANQSSLILHDTSSQGCCFRIKFAHPEKQHNLI